MAWNKKTPNTAIDIPASAPGYRRQHLIPDDRLEWLALGVMLGAPREAKWARESLAGVGIERLDAAAVTRDLPGMILAATTGAGGAEAKASLIESLKDRGVPVGQGDTVCRSVVREMLLRGLRKQHARMLRAAHRHAEFGDSEAASNTTKWAQDTAAAIKALEDDNGGERSGK